MALLPESGLTAAVIHPDNEGSASTGEVTRGYQRNKKLNQWVNIAADFSAVGNDSTDNTSALASAVSNLSGRNLWIPQGIFRVSELVLDGLEDFIIDGPGRIVCTDADTPAIAVTDCSNFQIVGRVSFGHTSTAIAGGRTDTGHGMHVQGCDEYTVDGYVYDTTAAGVYQYGCSNGTVNTRVRNTLADGIHITGASHDITVTPLASATDTGDDGIAVVSYQADADVCARIDILGRVLRSKARGVSCVGGRQVNLRPAAVTATKFAGIYVAQETSFATREVEQCTVHGAVIRDANTYDSPSVDHPAILVVGGDVAFPVRKIKISDCNIDGSGTLDIRVINDSGSDYGVYGVDTIGNMCSNNGVRVDSPSIQYTGAHGVFYGQVKNNHVINATLQAVQIANTCKYVDVSGNVVTDCNTANDGSVYGIDNQSVNGTTGPNLVVDEASHLTGRFSRGQEIITGSRAGNAALADLLTTLAARNEITDSTS